MTTFEYVDRTKSYCLTIQMQPLRDLTIYFKLTLLIHDQWMQFVVNRTTIKQTSPSFTGY